MISPLSRLRALIVSATVSSTSERFPPTSRWISIAITAQSKSAELVRSTIPFSESDTERPRRASTIARLNSRAVGFGASALTASIAWRSEYPALRDVDISVNVSGSCFSKFFLSRRPVKLITKTIKISRPPNVIKPQTRPLKTSQKTPPAADRPIIARIASPGAIGMLACSKAELTPESNPLFLTSSSAASVNRLSSGIRSRKGRFSSFGLLFRP